MAAAFRESSLKPGVSAPCAGLFQLCSQGYINKANSLGGAYKWQPNLGAILPSYTAYWKSNPGALPGAAAAAVEKSGQSAAWYAEPLSWIPKSFKCH